MSYGILQSVICHCSDSSGTNHGTSRLPGLVLAVAPPDIEVVINGKARQRFKNGFSRSRRNPISLGMTQQFARDNHRLLLDERGLLLFVHDCAPGIDLFVNVDLDRTNVCAASVQRRGERELAVAANL